MEEKCDPPRCDEGAGRGQEKHDDEELEVGSDNASEKGGGVSLSPKLNVARISHRSYGRCEYRCRVFSVRASPGVVRSGDAIDLPKLELQEKQSVLPSARGHLRYRPERQR